jgi:hypothetical protein
VRGAACQDKACALLHEQRTTQLIPAASGVSLLAKALARLRQAPYRSAIPSMQP